MARKRFQNNAALDNTPTAYKAGRKIAENAPGVMIFNGKSYAVGLLWFTVQEDNSKGLLQNRIKKTKADFTCSRINVAMQQGFGWLAKGHRRGMPAAAAIVADQLVGEWHGVFEGDNGWWYVQVRSDTITPNGDRFFTSEEEAYNVFQKEMGEHIWPHAYAPEKWGFTEGTIRELQLKNILDDLNTTTLTPTHLTALFGGTAARNMVLSALGAAFALMAGLVFYTLFGQSAPLPPPPTSASVARTVQKKAAAAAQQQAAIQAVSPQQLIAQCGEALAGLYQSLPGWKPQNFTCSVGRAVMAWQQTTGSLNEAQALGLQKWPQGTSVTFSNKIMAATVVLGSLPKVERQELPTQPFILMALEQNLQPLGAVQVKPVVPKAMPVKTGAAAKNAKPVPALAPYMDILLTSGFNPGKISPLLTGSGLELSEMQWKVPQAMWQYKLKWTYQNPVVTTAKPAVKTPATTTPAAGGAS